MVPAPLIYLESMDLQNKKILLLGFTLEISVNNTDRVKRWP
jgi:hypothetical protein